jgi:hypothetical protein
MPVDEKLAWLLWDPQVYETATYLWERSSSGTWMHLQLIMPDGCGEDSTSRIRI